MDKDKKLIKRLLTANWVCNYCGEKYGYFPDGHSATFHYDICDVCGKEKSCTEPRDYLYFKKYLSKGTTKKD